MFNCTRVLQDACVEKCPEKCRNISQVFMSGLLQDSINIRYINPDLNSCDTSPWSGFDNQAEWLNEYVLMFTFTFFWNISRVEVELWVNMYYNFFYVNIIYNTVKYVGNNSWLTIEGWVGERAIIHSNVW